MIPKLIIHPEISKREEYIQKYVADLGFDINHPDLLWFKSEEKLGIEQARKINNFLKLKPFKAEGQTIVLLSSENLTVDAQNALLKMLEEHPEKVNVILGTISEEVLLPTLISRCQIIRLNEKVDEIDEKELEKFYKQIEKLETSVIEERFKFIEKLENKEQFLIALTHFYRNKLSNSKPKEPVINFLKTLLETNKWMNANVNNRAILEYLMLKMPMY